MAEFLPAVNNLLRQEGGWVNDKRDLGGATNYGISLRFLREAGQVGNDGFKEGDLDKDGDVDSDDIRRISQEDAKDIYRKYWWDRYGYSRIKSQEIANLVLSISVNRGPFNAHRLIQKAACTNVDGKFGPKTVAAINSGDQRKLLDAFRIVAEYDYRELVLKNPKLEIYLNGWLNRIYDPMPKGRNEL